MLDDILSQVQKPARYIGEEWNVSRKEFAKAEIKFALCFPDLYEVGMSNLGLRIIYGILNNIPGVACERFFACALDMEELLHAQNMKIFSLESKRRLKEFDLVGFSLAHELNYVNVLSMLDLGGIPLESHLRDESHPLIIAGGPCALNPEPMHEFMDLYLIGEAEEAIVEIIDLYRQHKDKFKSGKICRRDLLIMFAHIEGVYVPSLYEVTYNSAGKIEKFRPNADGVPVKIKKRFVRDLEKSYFPTEWLVPNIQIIHDRIILEIMRGCPNSCRFCQARSLYYPYRNRQVQTVLGLAQEAYQRSGYEEISLAGLSVSDYPQVEKLLTQLFNAFKTKDVSISLPSLKPRSAAGNLFALIASVKKTGLTFAPEAASERLRAMLNKDFNTQDFFNILEQAYLCGYQHIKLYFMIGLPFEEKEDLDAIRDFALAASELRRKIAKRPAQVNISVNTLIPKPHTPFQWLRMPDLETIIDKQAYLKGKISRRNFRIAMHNPYISIMEAILSRGDRRLSKVILSVFNQGARFQAWENYFDFQKWREAFAACQIDPAFYLQEKSPDEILAWDFLDVGVSKEYLLSEIPQAPLPLK